MLGMRKSLYLFFLCLCMTGCASKAVTEERGDLCGLIIDENNNPVSQFVVGCRKENEDFEYCLTNERGMFIFQSYGGGEYFIKGEKDNYAILKEEKVLFMDRSKIFCFQINSIDGVLNNVEKLVLCGQYESALKMLDEIKTREGSPAEEIVGLYSDKIRGLLEKGEADEE